MPQLEVVQDGGPNHVLAVDDDPMSLRLLAHQLAALDVRVTTAIDGNRAWQALSRDEIDVAILDWVMPGKTGLELCRMVRDASFASPPYLIILTANTSHAEVVAAFDAGADDYIAKPFHADELLARTRAGLRLVQMQKALLRRTQALEEAARHIRQLQGLLPICAYCKRIRSDSDVWLELESYISQHSEAEFSHGICPHCLELRRSELASQHSGRNA